MDEETREQEQQDEQRQEQQDQGAQAEGGQEELSSKEKTQQEEEELDAKMKEMEEDPPEKLEDWPDSGPMKYKTFGGGEGDHGYDEGPEKKLGPSSLAHKEDGSVEIEGEEVDDPDEFKAEPIPGGPTDPNAPKVAGERDLSDEGGGDESGSDEGDSEDDSSKEGRSEQS